VQDQTVDLARGPFWTNGIFWGAAGAIAVVLSIIVLAWVSIRVAKPKRQLWCSLTSATPLIAGQPGMSSELRVMYGDEQLAAPHTVGVILRSRGRRIDILRAAFDKEQPLAIDVGATILEILERVTDPDRTLPEITHDGSRLLIGPSLIKWNQNIAVALLTEGRPELGPLGQQLENIDIRRGDPEVKVSISELGLPPTIGLLDSLASSLVRAAIAVWTGQNERKP
jgi:hypothetical protein